MSVGRRLSALAPLLVAAALTVAACSGSSRSDDAATTTAPVGNGVGRPVTIEHRFGATEIATPPRRVVSLDVQWTDVLLAMDVTPVGYLADFNIPEGFPWREDRLAGATALEATSALPFEQIRRLQPDLIVVTYLAEDGTAYDMLTDIAPTISTLSGSEVDTWQEIAGAAGQVMGDPEAAAAVVSEVDAEVADLAAELDGLAGKTFALANYVSGDAIYVVSDPDDGAVVLFDQLGLEIPPAVVDAGDGSSGRATLSLERTDLLDADLLLLLTNGADPESIPGYQDLPAVATGGVALLDYATATAVNTPTPLSVPYALDQLRPALAAAAGS